jgi:hypothetical protein
MLRVVLPAVAITAINALSVAVQIAIGVIYEVVVTIDDDVVVSSSPAGIPTATPSPGRSHRHSNAK